MALNERLALLVSLNADGAIRGLNDVGKAADRNLGRTENRLDRTAQQFQRAGVGMLATAGLLGAGLFKAGQSAADLEQAVGGTEAVFKDASGTIDEFAKDSATAMGLSERAFREATTSIGGQLKGLGFNTKDAADKAVELTGVAADLAATYGGTTAEAVQALGAAFRGEADPAERFNLRLNQTTVNAKAVELGLASSTSQVDAQAKAQATLALITEQSADAQGQFARETDSAAGSMQIANAEFENAKAALGESVAPIIADVAGGLSKLAGGFSSANEASGGLVSKLATFGTVGLAAAGGLSFTIGKVIDMRDRIGGLVSNLRTGTGAMSRFGRAAVGAGATLGALAIASELLNREASKADLSKLERDLLNLAGGGKVSGEALDLLGGDMRTLQNAIEDIAKPSNISQVSNAINKLGTLGQDANALEQSRQVIEDLDAALSGLAAKDPDAAAAALEAIASGLSDADGARLLGLLDEYDSSLAAAEVTTKTTTTATEGLTTSLDEAEGAYGTLVDAVIGFADSDLALRTSIDKTDDSLIELAAAQKEAADKGGTNKEANEALEDALRDAEGAMYDQANAAVTAAEDAATLGNRTLTASEKQAILRAELVKVSNGLAPGSALRNNIDATILRLDALATNRSAKIDIQINEMRNRITAQKLSGERAAGGPVSSGRTYLVGERGPELFTAGASGYVTPNSALGGATTTPAGDIVIQIGDEVIARVVANASAVAARRGVG